MSAFYPFADDNRGGRTLFDSADTVSVPENIATTAPVYTAHAHQVRHPHRHLHYALQSGVDDNDLFSINASTGVVTFKVSPDYEGPHGNDYTIVVTAYGAGRASRADHAVHISVTDVNDNAPVFTSATTASTPENVSTATVVYTAHATDADGTPANNTVHYSLAANVGDNNLFDIDANTGAVTFKVSPDYEHPMDAGANNVYDIVVTASDGLAAHNVTQSVAIKVTDVNDNAPIFTSDTTGSEAENTLASNVVYTAHATDADGTAPNNTVSYALSGTDAAAFRIDATTGAVTFKTSPDYEHPTDADGNNLYDIVVTATDGGNPPLSASKAVTIAVTDVNDNAPIFTSATTAATPENVSTSTAVYTAHATDADGTSPNNSITYSLSGTDAAAFNINATTGAVTFKASPDYEHPTDAGGNNVYDIVVKATDGGSPALSSTQAVAISITDVNDNAPVFTSGTTGSEAENTPASSVVYTAHATDADGTAPNNTVSYALSGTDAAAFQIDATTGAVTFKTSPDFEHPSDADGNNLYDIVVTATDGGTPPLSASKAVTIAVTDVNDNAPIFTSGTAASEAENTVATNVVYAAHATDADGTSPNNRVTYSLSGTDATAFNIDATTGAVTFKTAPDYEHPTDAGGNNVYDIVVTATDGGSPALSTSQAVAISVTDVNDNAPVFTSATTASTPENVSTSTAVYIAHATDADGTAPNNSVTYALSGTDAAAFNIDASTGAVTFKTSPDYEHPTDAGGNNVYDIVLTATDGGHPALSATQAVEITVTDVNDNAPVFTSGTSASEAENTNASHIVYTAHATDADGTSPNNSVSYSLSGADAAAFSIDAASGAVTFKTAPDYERPTDASGNNVYDIVVTATDGGSPALSTSQAVAISVTDVNDNAPVFTSATTASTPENVSTSTVVYVAHATDADGTAPNNIVSYSLSGADAAAFNIDATTGAVTFKTSPDYEHPTDAGGDNIYDIIVTATDGGTPALSASRAVAIAVTDVNDNAPVFTSGATASEAENSAVSNVVYTAHATDADGTSPNNSVTYTLAGTDAAAFDIDATTGAVTFKSSPDYEHPTDAGGNNVYDIVVTATDGGSPALSTSQAVAISVTDVNDNAPVFTSGTTASAPEGTATTTTVYAAHATDADGTSPNNSVTYTLSGTDAAAFDIDASTGAVTFKTSPDYEHPTDAGHNDIYDIIVTATDGGSPALSASQAVAISVTDVAPSAPTDSDAATPNSVAEGAAAGTYTGVTAASSDVNGGTVSYSLIGDTSGGGFTVDATTGRVTVADPTKIDYETASGHAYSVVVQASDGTLTSSQSFSISVTDVAPSTPADSDGATSNSVAEGAAAGTYTGLTASSTDVNGPAVSYSLTADTSGGGFAIDPVSGRVTVADPTKVDYESSPGHAYSVTVAASDGTLSTSQTFSISVTDVAPSTPTDSDIATANSVIEGAAAGTYTGLTASSIDVNGPAATYSMIGDTSAGGFTVDATTGRVTVADPTKIDYESAPGHAYAVTVAASDGTLTSLQTFAIAVVDAPPSAPSDVDPSANQVSGGASQGSSTGVTAFSTDPNGGAVTYSLTNDDGGHFQINASTGVVTAGATPLVYDSANTANDTRTITVQAADSSGMASTHDFAIAVLADTPPTANDDTLTATEEGGTANGTAGHNPAGNVILGTGGNGEVADTDQQDPSSALVVVAFHTGAEGSAGQTAGTVGQALAGAYGSLTLNSDGSYTYDVDNANPTVNALNPSQTLTDTFNYTIQDTGGLQDTATIRIVVHGANDAPVAHPDAVSVTEAGGIANATAGVNPTFNVITGTGETIATGADTDPDAGDSISVAGVAAGTTMAALASGANADVTGTYGTIHINGDGSATYTVDNSNATVQALATASDTVTDTFSYTVTDTGGLTSTTQVAVTIHGQDDAPTANAVTASGNENAASIPITVTGSDPDTGDSVAHFTVTSLPTPAQGTLYSDAGLTQAVAANADFAASGNATTFYFKPAANFNGPVTFNVTATDTHGLTGAAATETINVAAVNVAPVNTVPSNGSIGTAFSNTDFQMSGFSVSDVDGGSGIETTTLAVSHGVVSVTAGGGATVTNNGTGTVTVSGTVAQINATLGHNVTYHSADGFTGEDDLVVTTNDNGNTGAGGAQSTTNTVRIGVVPQVFVIDNSATSSSNAGTSANPFKTLAAFNASSAPGTGDYVYLANGTGSYNEANGLVLHSGETLLGGNQALQFVNPVTGAVVTVESGTGSASKIVTGGTGLTLSSGNTVQGLSLDTSSGTGSGVSDGGGNVGTLNMSGIAVTSAGGTGIALTHGGTVSMTGVNTLSSTTGTALDIANTTIAAGGVNFKSIATTGSSGNAGIILDTTGSLGGLHVTGTGVAGSGGSIANKTGADIVATNATTHAATVSGTAGTGIFLRGTADVQLNDMSLSNFSNYGIYGNNVTGFQLSNSTINGTNGTNSAANHEEGSIRFDNLLTNATYGTASITNSNISGGDGSNVFVSNTSGTLNRLTMTGDTIGADAVLDHTVGNPYNNVSLAAYNAGTVANLTFGGDGSGQGNTVTGSAGALLYTNVGSGASTDVVVRHDTFQNAQTQNAGQYYGAVSLNSEGATSGLTFDISHNGWTGPGTTTAASAAFEVSTGLLTGAGGTTSGTINANTINGGADGVATAINVEQHGNGTGTVLVSNNTISNYGEGIYAQNDTGSGTMNLSIFGNVINQPNAAQSPPYAIGVDNGIDNGSTDTTNVAIGSHTDSTKQNTISDPSGLLTQNNGADGDIALNIGVSSSTINLSQSGATTGTRGQANAPNNLSQIQQLLNQDNTGNNGGSSTLSADDSGGLYDAAIVGSMPSLPPAVAPMLAAAGGVAATVVTPGVAALTQAALDGVVHAAIADWIAAGATAAQVTALEAATYQVADLPTGVLGREGPGLVQISTNAAGYGWYVDPTPSSNVEFAHAANAAGTNLYADPTSAAAGHMDLLTTVLHEMGHVIDLADTSLPSDANDLMYVAQVVGERRLPDAIDVASAGAGVPVAHVMVADPSAAVALHLRDLAAGETARVEAVPDDGTLTLRNGTTVHAGMSLTAHQLATLDLHAGQGSGSADYFLFDVIDAHGVQTAMRAVDVEVSHGSGVSMVGSAQADRIVGSAGDDVIYGGGGHDVLTGGGGADRFVFDQASLSPTPGSKPHVARITDYSAAQGDVIDLSRLFSGSTAGIPTSDLVRVAEVGGHAVLDTNTGTAAAPHWAEIAHLHDVHAGATVDVVVDPNEPVVHLHAGIVS